MDVMVQAPEEKTMSNRKTQKHKNTNTNSVYIFVSPRRGIGGGGVTCSALFRLVWVSSAEACVSGLRVGPDRAGATAQASEIACENTDNALGVSGKGEGEGEGRGQPGGCEAEARAPHLDAARVALGGARGSGRVPGVEPGAGGAPHAGGEYDPVPAWRGARGDSGGVDQRAGRAEGP